MWLVTRWDQWLLDHEVVGITRVPATFVSIKSHQTDRYPYVRYDTVKDLDDV